MAYTMNPRLFDAGNGVLLPTTNIAAIIPYTHYQGRLLVQNEYGKGTLINIASRNKRESCIVLNNGVVAVSNIKPAILRNRFNKAYELKKPAKSTRKGDDDENYFAVGDDYEPDNDGAGVGDPEED